MDNGSNGEMQRVEILEANYWEHFKMAKDMSLYLPIDHPKRVNLEIEINKMLKKIHELKRKSK